MYEFVYIILVLRLPHAKYGGCFETSFKIKSYEIYLLKCFFYSLQISFSASAPRLNDLLSTSNLHIGISY